MAPLPEPPDVLRVLVDPIEILVLLAERLSGVCGAKLTKTLTMLLERAAYVPSADLVA
jgi:hypothetical protein